MVGLVNIFLYILKNPSLPITAPDVATLDIVVGHFGHLEVATSSELSYPFAREVAAIAYKSFINAKIPGTGSNTKPMTPADKSVRISNVDISNDGVFEEVRSICIAFIFSFCLTRSDNILIHALG